MKNWRFSKMATGRHFGFLYRLVKYINIFLKFLFTSSVKNPKPKCSKIKPTKNATFFNKSKWRPAAIFHLTSKVKFDSRNEFRMAKTIENYILHYFVRLKWADYDLFWIFQYGRRRPSWIFEIPYILSFRLSFYSVGKF